MQATVIRVDTHRPVLVRADQTVRSADVVCMQEQPVYPHTSLVKSAARKIVTDGLMLGAAGCPVMTQDSLVQRFSDAGLYDLDKNPPQRDPEALFAISLVRAWQGALNARPENREAALRECVRVHECAITSSIKWPELRRAPA